MDLQPSTAVMKSKKIGIIGCGNLGSSILNGLIANENISNNNIVATRTNLQVIDCYKDAGVHLTSDNAQAVKESEILIVALKPFKILSVLDSLKTIIDPKKHIVVSLATGISIQELENVLGQSTPIFRAMPNTAAEVGMSMTCLCSNTVNEGHNDLIKGIFDSIGATLCIKEDMMDSATVLGASGIAFVLRFMRAMTQGGVQVGFDAKTANQIVQQTVKGAAELLIASQAHPESEIDKVTTPNGCTIAGLNEMEHNGLSSAVIMGIISSLEQIKK